MYIKTEQIRRLRREKDFSQDYMAEMLEISQPQYSRIENGESSIDLEKTSKIAEVLGANPLDILEFEDKQSYYNCTNSGYYLNTFNNNESFEKEREAYLSQIKELKEDKEFLKQENLSLKKMLDKLVQ
ncbi:hypothetical protein ASG22_10400 [Chryseobacterium sp. Leaf405]|uniref:helix-turn-helix domain-containing protein n=1 Tax=Chryseobacterium sp. Leaf405 TaxID=1736367 RepID=UPI0006FF443D|nr:helix-turn-helix transcriptional regulator [Chryseobacterium sp. Leaf405]KQT24411.1 hypothetical protein ASG22_10400 [Chryseobacterium sp. Leaf405]